MCSHPIYILFLVLFASTQAIDPTPSQIIELFSEGARSPLTNYDPSWSDIGMLTPLGLRQQYILGKVISEKYPNLLANTNEYNLVYMLSSNLPRTIQSAGAHFYGISLGDGPALSSKYPPNNAIPPYKDANASQVANSLPNSQALPHNSDVGYLNVVNEKNVYIFLGDQSVYCPNVVDWMNQNSDNQATETSFLSLFNDTMINLNNILPQDLEIEASDDILEFGDTLFANLYDNRTLPGGLNDSALITNITWAYTWVQYRLTQGQQIQRELSAFNLVQEFISQLSSFRQGEPYNLAALYSGHDSNLFALLSAFGVMNEECIVANFKSVLESGTLVYPNCHMVAFSSNIIIEFYNDTNAPYVKLYYDNVPVSICGGKYECPYDEFTTFAMNSVGTNTLDTYFAKCGASSVVEARQKNIMSQQLLALEQERQQTASRFLATVISTNVVMAVVCLVLIFFILWNKKRYAKEMKMGQAKLAVVEENTKQNEAVEIKLGAL